MTKVKGILLDLSEEIEDGKGVMHLHVKGDKYYHLRDTSFEPFFFVIPEKDVKVVEKGIKNIEVEDKLGSVTAKRVEVFKGLYLGKMRDLIKVIVNKSKDINLLRDELKEWDEVEGTSGFTVRAETKYLANNNIEASGWIECDVDNDVVKSVAPVDRADLKPLVFATLDIETYSKQGVPDFGDDPVIAISYVSSSGAEKVFSVKKSKHKYVVFCKDEVTLFDKFSEFVVKDDPDVVFTYNGDRFDIPYLKKRARVLKRKIVIGRENQEIMLGGGGKTVRGKIPGRVHVDVYQMIRFLATIGVLSLPRYKLERVYEHVFNKRKTEIPGHLLWKAWDDDADLVCKYNLEDSIACQEIGLEFLSTFIETSKLAGLPLFTSTRVSTGTIGESFLVSRSMQLGEVAPRRPKNVPRYGARDKFEGAFVMEPEPGIKERIVEYDYRSLYPTIILSHNISPETVNIKDCKKFYKSPNKIKICKDFPGFVPRVLGEILDKRVAVKTEMKKHGKDSNKYKELYAKQYALKIVGNSVHGEEPVVLKQGSKVFVSEIGKFIDSNLKRAIKVESSELSEPPENLEILSFDNENIKFMPVTKLIRHKNSENLYKVTLNSGRSIKLTADHGLFIYKKGKFKEIQTAKIKVGTPVVVPIAAENIETKIKEINFLKLLSNLNKRDTNNLYIKIESNHFRKRNEVKTRFEILQALKKIKKGNIEEIANQTSRNREAVGKRLSKLEIEGYVIKIPCPMGAHSQSKFFKLTAEGARRINIEKAFLKNFKYSGWAYYANFNELRNIIKDLTYTEIKEWELGTNGGKPAFINCATTKVSQFFRFLGYYVSEGSCYTGKNKGGGTSFSISITQNAGPIKQDIIKCMRDVFGKKPYVDNKGCSLHQKSIYLILKYLRMNKKASKKRIPELVFSSTKKLKTEFLYGYYQGDGDKASYLTRMTSLNKKLIQDLGILCLMLGSCDFHFGKDSGVYRLKVHDGLTFKKAKRQKTRTYADNLPKEIVMPLAKKVSKIKNLEQIHRKTISIRKTKEVLTLYEKQYGITNETKALRKLIKSKLRLDRVKKIEEVTNQSEYVYDFSVKETERFLAGTGLIGVHNSIYGLFGYQQGRWYSREGAEAITGWAREYTKMVIAEAKDFGLNPVYADTDSMYAEVPKDWKDSKLIDFLELINSKLPEKMELEFEEVYKRGLFVSTKAGERGAKKKYALLDGKGQIKIKGFEFVRRDWADIAKNTQMLVLRDILEGNEKNAINHVKKVIERLKSKKVPLSELVIHTQIKRKLEDYSSIGPHVAAAKKAGARGVHFSPGMTIDMIITSKGKSISDRAEAVQFVKEGDYDADYYINNQVISSSMRILSILGYSNDDLLQDGSQKDLNKWFGGKK